ncbi:hypothetical protein PPRY_a4073 [Pseudoalteromonas prydzensis ACAM 620]|nr:hypothetical protein [Pseudoalteromonas prydzensis ACAM 620]
MGWDATAASLIKNNITACIAIYANQKGKEDHQILRTHQHNLQNLFLF